MLNRQTGLLIGVSAVVALTGCAGEARNDSARTKSGVEQDAARTADTIYIGGPIVTMDDGHPTAEAVAVQGGRVLLVGSRTEVMAIRGASTRVVDLGGRTLLPGFVDAHGHVSMVGFQAMSANLLPPPDGPNKSIADLQKTLREYQRSSSMPGKFGVIFGFGYDDAQLAEQRHPTRADLDAVSSEMPIVIVHQSSHLGVANSKALEMAGITAETKDPAGGVFRRENGAPNGVMEEVAFFSVLMKIMPKLSPEESVAMLQAGQSLYLMFGYTTQQDGRATPGLVKTGMLASEWGRLKADVVSYPDALEMDGQTFMDGPFYSRSYTGHFRIGGVKLTLDGSPQGKTAWLTKAYFRPPEHEKPGYAGFSVVTDERATAVYDSAFRHGWQVLTHANGDRAIDQMIACMRPALERAGSPTDHRSVLIHGQTMREDQVEAIREMGVFPSLFPMHTYYWGDWHRQSVLGPERAENISPTGWVLARGMKFSSHHDAPAANPDSMRVLSATVNRTTRTGYVLGAQHRVDPATALKAMTLWPAYQHFEEGSKGSIEPGKLADFVVLSENPLTIDRSRLAEVVVMETIKEDVSVYRRPANAEAPGVGEMTIAAHSSPMPCCVCGGWFSIALAMESGR